LSVSFGERAGIFEIELLTIQILARDPLAEPREDIVETGQLGR
jgi:hypothetical protein